MNIMINKYCLYNAFYNISKYYLPYPQVLIYIILTLCTEKMSSISVRASITISSRII